MVRKKYLRALLFVSILAVLGDLFGLIDIPWLFIPPELKIILVLFLVFIVIMMVELIG